MKYILALLCIISTVSVCFGYTPPIGIPDPGMWGQTHPIDGSPPVESIKCPNWPTTQTVGCYYIDNTHVSATDTDNIYGYPDKPRSSIPLNKTFSAGSYVLINGGPYDIDTIHIYQGTIANPVWIRGTSFSNKANIQGRIFIKDSTYAIMENLDFNTHIKAGINFSLSASTNNVCVRNSTFRDVTALNGSTLLVQPAEGGAVHDIVLYNNYFAELGDYLSPNDDDLHAILIALWGKSPPTTVYNVWVLDSEGYHVGGSFAQMNGDQRSIAVAIAADDPTLANMGYLHHVYVGRNLWHHSRQDLAVTKMTRDAVISQNTIYDNFNIKSGNGVGVVLQEGPDYVWIIYNLMYNLSFGVKQGNMYGGYHDWFGQQKAFIIGNVVYDLTIPNYDSYATNSRWKHGQGVGTESGNLLERWVVDNTFNNVAGGINMTTAYTTDSAFIYGNAIANIYGVDSLGRQDSHLSRTEEIGTILTDYNYFQHRADTSKSRFFWAGATTVNTTSVAEFQTATGGQCMNCLESADPLFVDTETNNFRPQAGSPLIGANARHEVYDIFEARYGLSIDVDFDGNPRPPTAAEGRTIGAFEYNSSYVPECDQYHPSLCTDSASCTTAGLSWCDGECQVNECGTEPTCSDETQNGEETGVDCGGSCPPCETPTPQARRFRMAGPVKIVNQPE
jgi:hypothetical protein